MAIIKNFENNVILEVELIQNEYLDIGSNKSDFERWIPFLLKLNINGRVLGYSDEDGATFTVFELGNLIKTLEEVIDIKRMKKEINRTEFSSSEAFFDIIFDETFEEDEVYIEFWINTAICSKGQVNGYEEGVRIVSSIEELEIFKNELKCQMEQMI